MGRWTAVLMTLVLALGLVPVAWANSPTQVPLEWPRESVQIQDAGSGQISVQMTGGVSQPDLGAPDLPWMVVQVPASATSRVVSWAWHPDSKETLLTSVTPTPTWLDRPSAEGGSVPSDPDPVIYQGNTGYPSDPVRYLGLQSASGEVVAIFHLCPFLWDPATRTLSFSGAGTLDITWAADGSPDRFLAPSLRTSGGSSLDKSGPAPEGYGVGFSLGGIVDTYSRPSLDTQAVSLVIITDTTLVSAFTPLVDWKNRSGSPTAMRTVQWIERHYPQGVDLAEKMRLFLKDAHMYWGTNSLILGGDPALVPIRYGRNYFFCPKVCDIATDLYYACLDGTWNANGNSYYGEPKRESDVGDDTDLRPELRVGRISARNPIQVNDFMKKYMKYVKDPVRTNSAYLDSTLILGEVLFDAGWTRSNCPECGNCPTFPPAPCPTQDGAIDCLAMIDSVKTFPGGQRFVFDQLYERYDYWNAKISGLNSRLEETSSVLDALTRGRNVVFQMGHGDRDRWAVGGKRGEGRFQGTDATKLDCAEKYAGMAYTVNCNSAAVDADCLGEAWCFSPAGGGLEYIGSTNLDFPGPAKQITNSFFHQWLRDDRTTPGQAFKETIDQYAIRIGATEQGLRFLLYSVILLGDPDMQVWKSVPGSLTVGALPAIYPGENSVTVNVNFAGGAAADGATVCLYKARDAIAYGITNPSGSVTLPFRPDSTGTYLLTVSHPLAVPYMKDDQKVVLRSGPKSFVAVTNYRVNDGPPSAATYGNQNGQMEMEETVSFGLSLSNRGDAPSTSALNLHLRIGKVEGKPWFKAEVMNGDSVKNVSAPIGVGATKEITEAFHVRISQVGSAPPSDTVRIVLPLSLVISDGPAAGDTHIQPLSPVVYRPNLILIGTRLRDSGGSGSDGEPDDGETIAMVLELYNRGGGTASYLRGRIRPDLPNTVTFSDSLVSFDDVGEHSSGVSDTCRFTVQTGGVSLALNLLVEDTLSVPPRLLLRQRMSVAKRPFAPSDLHTYGNLSNIQITWAQPDTGASGFRVYRATDTTQTYQPTGSGFVPVQHTYTDEGLPPLSRYFYRVVAVTRSGMESKPSWAVEGNSAPGSAAGWPNYMVGSRDECPTFEHLFYYPQGYQTGGVITLVHASDLLYAFNGDGSEYTDGDRVTSTRGPLIDGRTDKMFFSKVAICDLDRDGKKEVIAGATQGGDTAASYARILCLDREGKVKWRTRLPNFQAVVSSPAIGDIDGDGDLEVVLVFNRWVIALNKDGKPFHDLPGGKLFDIPGGADQISSQAQSVALADLDNDGRAEIIFSPDPKDDGKLCRLYVLKAQDGAVQAVNAPGFPFRYERILPSGMERSTGSVAVGDVTRYVDGVTGGDPDDKPDIIVHTRSQLWVFDPSTADSTKVLVWHKAVEPRVLQGESSPLTSSPALGDIDGDGKSEIAVGGYKGKLYVFDGKGNALTGFRQLDGSPAKSVGSSVSRIGSPIMADLSGDRRADVIVGDNEGKVYALKWDGSSVAGFPYTVPAGRIGVGLAAWDFDNNGSQNLAIQADLVQKLTVLDFPSCPFDSAAAPWPQFRHDAKNTGFILSDRVTPIERVTLLADTSGALTVELRFETRSAFTSFALERRMEPDGEWERTGEFSASEIAESPGVYRLQDQVPQGGSWAYRLLAIDSGGQEHLIGETSVSFGGLPAVFRLYPPRPNPFHPGTTVRLDLPRKGPCAVQVVDASGRLVRGLREGPAGPGTVVLVWDGRDDAGRSVGSGVYFVRVDAGKQGKATSKVIRLN